MSKKKKSRSSAPTPAETHAETAPAELAETLDEAEAASTEPPANGSSGVLPDDVETTVNLTGDVFSIPGRDDLEAPTQTGLPEAVEKGLSQASKKHLRGLLEALIFASDHPIKANELAKTSSAQLKEVKEILDEMKEEYASRGVQLEEIAGGWLFRTSPLYAPFVRDLTKRKPVKLSRAQIETLAILAYRQPITRPEIDEIRGVDSGPVLKLLLERDLVRILGKKDEPGRPLLYGTTTYFLEFFGLKAIKDLPTLREFTELNEDSRRIVEQELGETLETVQDAALEADQMAESTDFSGVVRDTLAPPAPTDSNPAASSEPGPSSDADAEVDSEAPASGVEPEREPE